MQIDDDNDIMAAAAHHPPPSRRRPPRPPRGVRINTPPELQQTLLPTPGEGFLYQAVCQHCGHTSVMGPFLFPAHSRGVVLEPTITHRPPTTGTLWKPTDAEGAASAASSATRPRKATIQHIPRPPSTTLPATDSATLNYRILSRGKANQATTAKK